MFYLSSSYKIPELPIEILKPMKDFRKANAEYAVDKLLNVSTIIYNNILGPALLFRKVIITTSVKSGTCHMHIDSNI